MCLTLCLTSGTAYRQSRMSRRIIPAIAPMSTVFGLFSVFFRFRPKPPRKPAGGYLTRTRYFPRPPSLIRSPDTCRSPPRSTSCRSPWLNRRATVIGFLAGPSRTTSVFTITEPSVHSIWMTRTSRFTATSLAGPPAGSSATTCQPPFSLGRSASSGRVSGAPCGGGPGRSPLKISERSPPKLGAAPANNIATARIRPLLLLSLCTPTRSPLRKLPLPSPAIKQFVPRFWLASGPPSAP